MRKKVSAVAMVAVFLLSIGLGVAPCLADGSEASSRTLVVETSPDFAPYDYYFGTQFAGIDMDILRAVARDTGYNIEFRQNNFDSIILSVTQGKCDFGASGFTISEERKKSVDFTDSYSVIRQVVVTQKGNSSITSEKDLSGMRIAAQAGTSGYDYAETIDGAVLVPQKGYPEIVLDLLNRKVDCEIVRRCGPLLRHGEDGDLSEESHDGNRQHPRPLRRALLSDVRRGTSDVPPRPPSYPADFESGDGCRDIRMERVSGTGANVVVEFKKARSEGDLAHLANDALAQIRDRRCAEGLEGTTVLYGIAFFKKARASSARSWIERNHHR